MLPRWQVAPLPAIRSPAPRLARTQDTMLINFAACIKGKQCTAGSRISLTMCGGARYIRCLRGVRDEGHKGTSRCGINNIYHSGEEIMKTRLFSALVALIAVLSQIN